MSQTEIRLRMGSEIGKDFSSYWDAEVLGGKARPGTQARFTDEQHPSGGMGLALPSEVTLIGHYLLQLAQSDLGHEVLKAAGTAAGTAAAKFLWGKLRRFFTKPRPHAHRPPKKVMIIVDRREIVFDPEHMDSEPPATLIAAMQRVEEEDEQRSE